MVRSASKIAEPEANGEAQAKLRQASLQFETEIAVDASPEQPDETTRNVTPGAKEEIDADGIDDLNLGAPPPWPALSPIAPPTGPRMAPGVGGFNIDPPVPRASRVEGKVTSRTRDAERCQDRAVEQAPIRAQRMALIVERRESSAIPRVLAVIAIATVMLLMFREETREQLND